MKLVRSVPSLLSTSPREFASDFPGNGDDFVLDFASRWVGAVARGQRGIPQVGKRDHGETQFSFPANGAGSPDGSLVPAERALSLGQPDHRDPGRATGHQHVGCQCQQFPLLSQGARQWPHLQVHQRGHLLCHLRGRGDRKRHFVKDHLQEQMHEEWTQFVDREPGPGRLVLHHDRHPHQRL